MRLSRLALLMLSILPLACASIPHPEGKPMPALNFSALQPIPVKVGRIEVIDSSPLKSADFIVPPEQTLRDYLNARFSAQGSQDALRARITSATVTSAEKKAEGVGKYLDVAGHNVYRIDIGVTLEHVTDTGQILYSRGLKATRTMSITEHASVAEREKHQFRGMEEMFSELDARITEIVLGGMKLGQ
ncbi:MAG: hypothetical protein ACT4OY_03445 [Alphaproteobacteria bacterium]